MKTRFIILLVFVCSNLFGSNLFSIKDTTRLRLRITTKESSRALAAINNHLKYDEFYAIEYYMTDTLHLVINRTLYECNSSYVIEVLQRTRNVVKNNDYKYQLKVVEDGEDGSIYDYIYYGYSKRIIKGGYTVYDKYQVTLEFTEYNRKIIFVAIILSIMDGD